VRAYVARRAGVAVAVYLFRCENGRAIVLNEGMHVSEHDANRFASYLFRNHDGLSQVAFHFVEAGARRFAYPFQRAACGEDSMLELPSSGEAYTASLGPHTRAILQERLHRVRRELPGFRFAVYETQDVPVPHIRALIRLNRLHMQAKGMAPLIGQDEEESIIAYVALCGFVTVATSNGRVCAGAITYRQGSNFTARILAHDPTYGSYRLGITCAYLTICECIKAGGSRYFYFGWGQDAYRQHLGGRDRQLVHLSLFRSRLHVLGHAGPALGALLGGLAFRARRWLVRTASRKGMFRALRRTW
jgi:CelD/BcsL family acetyltransferase involved in cellulose biosynthesis